MQRPRCDVECPVEARTHYRSDPLCRKCRRVRDHGDDGAAASDPIQSLVKKMRKREREEKRESSKQGFASIDDDARQIRLPQRKQYASMNELTPAQHAMLSLPAAPSAAEPTSAGCRPPAVKKVQQHDPASAAMRNFGAGREKYSNNTVPRNRSKVEAESNFQHSVTGCEKRGCKMGNYSPFWLADPTLSTRTWLQYSTFVAEKSRLSSTTALRTPPRKRKGVTAFPFRFRF